MLSSENTGICSLMLGAAPWAEGSLRQSGAAPWAEGSLRLSVCQCSRQAQAAASCGHALWRECVKSESSHFSAQQGPGPRPRGHTDLLCLWFLSTRKRVPVGPTLARELPGGSKPHDTLRWTERQARVHFLLPSACLVPSRSKRLESSWSLVHTIKQQGTGVW